MLISQYKVIFFFIIKNSCEVKISFWNVWMNIFSFTVMSMFCVFQGRITQCSLGWHGHQSCLKLAQFLYLYLLSPRIYRHTTLVVLVTPTLTLGAKHQSFHTPAQDYFLISYEALPKFILPLMRPVMLWCFQCDPSSE